MYPCCSPPRPHPALPTACAHGAHLLAGLVATGLEHSGDGVSIADGAEILLTGGLQETVQGRLGLVAQTSGHYTMPRHCAQSCVPAMGMDLCVVAPLTREAAAAWADAAVRCASICSTWASSSTLM